MDRYNCEMYSDIVKKSMAYDLLCLLEENASERYTPDEIKAIIKAYITGQTQ